MGKISVIGSGSVGSNVAWLILINRLAESIVLIDVNEPWAKGTACDLNDSRFIFKSETFVEGTSDYSLLENSDIVVITAGSPRKPGMNREDLLKINFKIISSVSEKIKEYAEKAVVIVVTNPLDLMVYTVWKNTGFSQQRVLGMGASLDSSRLANIISRMTTKPISSIQPLVIGMHGKDMLVSSRTEIDGVELEKRLAGEDSFFVKEKTYNRGKEIVEYLKKSSARFAPAAAVLEIIEAIVKDLKKTLPVSCLLENKFGAEKACLAMPCIIGRNGIEEIVDLPLNSQEEEKIRRSVKNFQENLKCFTN